MALAPHPRMVPVAPRDWAEEAMLLLSPADLRVVAANQAAAELLAGGPGLRLVGREVSELLPDVAVVLQDRPPPLADETPPRSVLQIAFCSEVQAVEGPRRIVVAMHRLADGAEGLWLVRIENEQRRVHSASGRDPLTGLATRTELNRYLARYCHAGAQSEQPFALVFIDLDDFKSINDTQGHLAGDRVLAAAAAKLESAVRPEDLVVRFGGDEFVVLLGGVRTKKLADAVIKRMRRALADEIPASFGLALHSGGPGDPLALLSAADQAMYRDKAARKRAEKYTPAT